MKIKEKSLENLNEALDLLKKELMKKIWSNIMKEISDTFLACLGISNTIILLCILIIIAKNVKQIMIDSSYPIVLVLLSNVASSICKS